MSTKAQMKEIFRRNAHKIIMNYLKLPAYCALFFSLVIFAPPSCDTLKAVYNAGTYTTGTQAPTNIIVAGEKAAQIGDEAMNTFVKSEKIHRTAYMEISPKIHEYAEYLRQRVADPTKPHIGDPPTFFVPRGVAILKTLRSATEAFRLNRTPENQANLQTALATINDVIAKIQNFNQMTVTQP